MQNNVAFLAKKAVDNALKGNWQEAITINQQIIVKDSENIDAKIRLGRAYLQVKEFAKAKKLFKDVLDSDPINPVALKNYKLAAEKKVEKVMESINPKALIREPGMTTEISFDIEAKRILANDFAVGEELVVKIDKRHVSFFKKHKTEELFLGTVNSELSHKLNNVKAQGAQISATFLRGNEKHIRVMIKSYIPVFITKNQQLNTYIKKGSIDEPELEIPELEE